MVEDEPEHYQHIGSICASLGSSLRLRCEELIVAVLLPPFEAPSSILLEFLKLRTTV